MVKLMKFSKNTPTIAKLYSRKKLQYVFENNVQTIIL